MYRYFVGKNLRPKDDVFRAIRTLLSEVHARSEDSRMSRSLFPLRCLMEDSKFVQSVRAMNEYICKKQTEALKIIMNDVDKMVNSQGTPNGRL